MTYEEALQRWAKSKWAHRKDNCDHNEVYVDVDFNEGYACCGGADPYCYCSFAESPSFTVRISCLDCNAISYQDQDSLTLFIRELIEGV